MLGGKDSHFKWNTLTIFSLNEPYTIEILDLHQQ